MTFLPVVGRELRVASRRKGTYWGRFTAAFIGTVLAAWVLYTMANDQDKSAIGKSVFEVVSWVVFLYASVAGTLATCDCLSEEKRDGTLGLLFLTDLKGHDVVLGKLAATSFNAFYGMLAVLPMLAIPFILGGVTAAEMVRVVLVSINLLFFFLSIGLFVSSICRKDNWALALSVMVGLALVLGGPIAGNFALFRGVPYLMSLSSPAADCFLAFDSEYTRNPHAYFWLNFAATQFYAWVFFIAACVIVPRSWQDASAGKKLWWRRNGQAQAMRRFEERAGLLETNPFLWRVARSGNKGALVWAVLGIVFAIWWWSCGSSKWEPGMDLLLLIPAGLVLKCWLAAEASRTISEDKRIGGLELLLSTPLRERDIVHGQLLALWRQFGFPTIGIIIAYLLFSASGIRLWGEAPEDRTMMIELHLTFAGFLVADMFTLSWLGTWLGLIHRKPNRATLLALLRVVLAPTIIFVVISSLWAITAGSRNDGSIGGLLGLWIFLGVAVNLQAWLSSQAQLRSQFRTIVAEGLARKTRVEPVAQNVPALAEAR